MTYGRPLLLSLLVFFSYPATASELKPFASDGCSLFPDGSYAEPDRWLHCCVGHDLAYWKGGTSNQRQHSDQVLRQCVSDAGHPWIGAVMYAGVRLGGSPLWPTPFRWGFGWDYPRFYGPLSPEELDQVEFQSQQIDIMGKE